MSGETNDKNLSKTLFDNIEIYREPLNQSYLSVPNATVLWFWTNYRGKTFAGYKSIRSTGKMGLVFVYMCMEGVGE